LPNGDVLGGWWQPGRGGHGFKLKEKAPEGERYFRPQLSKGELGRGGKEGKRGWPGIGGAAGGDCEWAVAGKGSKDGERTSGKPD